MRKLTIEVVREGFKKDGYECLSKKYTNANQKLDYICPKGHRGSIKWNNWQQGIRCPVCAGNKKLTIDFVKLEFKKKGWVCTSNEYINSYSNLEYICPEGHIGSIQWSNWQQGHGCSTCCGIEMSKNHSGFRHYNWKGGISKEPYCQNWTKNLKEFVKERDDYKCMNPYCNSKSPNDLTIHHIDYNKKFCETENLITVCRSCNAAANKDRNWHKLWYKTILYRRYGKTTLKNVK